MRSARTIPSRPKRVLISAFALAGLALALLIGIGTRSHAQGPDAVQLAIGQGKPTVAEFGSTRCKACRDMKVVLDGLQQTHGERMAIADIDLFSPAGRGMISRYRVQMMPTQIFYDGQGKEIGRHLGPISAPEILKRLGIDSAARDTGATKQ